MARTTRSLVLRAGGTDTRRGNATLAEQDRESRTASSASFDAATQQMIANFDTALTRFESDVREGKANVKVVQRNALGASAGRGGGGGAFDPAWLALLLLLIALRRLSPRAPVTVAPGPR